MAKINRYPGNLKAFAAEALGTERTIFGDTAQADDLASNITADFLRGWGIVGVNENPTKQDFNGLAFTLGQLIAYLHQMGVSEWHTAQEYAQYGFCIGSDGRLYQSESAANIGNDPTTDAVNWADVFAALNIDYDNTSSGATADNVQDALDEIIAAGAVQIGQYVFVQDNITGATTPPSDLYIELTAGLTGVGGYNEGKLTNEVITGTAPLVVATADINDASSPMNGQTVNLINTEGRFIAPGASPGTVANDVLQGHMHLEGGGGTTPTRYGTTTGLASARNAYDSSDSAGNTTSRHTSTAQDDGVNGEVRVSDHTSPKNIQVTAYMRIK